MGLIAEHHTPDGRFRFIVKRSEDGDLCLGFDGFQWHNHGDILASLSGLTIDEAVGNYVDDLMNGRTYIAVYTVDGEIIDVAVADDLSPDKYKPDNELVEFRLWDGRRVLP